MTKDKAIQVLIYAVTASVLIALLAMIHALSAFVAIAAATMFSLSSFLPSGNKGLWRNGLASLAVVGLFAFFWALMIGSSPPRDGGAWLFSRLTGAIITTIVVEAYSLPVVVLLGLAIKGKMQLAEMTRAKPQHSSK